jgi:ribokinase
MMGRDDALLVQLEIPIDTVTHACRLAHGRGARIIVNAAPAQARTAELLPYATVLIVNKGEAAALLGAPVRDPLLAAQSLRDFGPDIAVVTLGGDGLVLSAAGASARHLPAQHVDVVDTTAAGDAFCGAFAAALLAHQPVADAARFASVAAALATTRPGAQSSLPSRAEVDAYLRQAPPIPLESHT